MVTLPHLRHSLHVHRVKSRDGVAKLLEHVHQGAGILGLGKLSHHLLGLPKLVQHLVDVLSGSAAAQSNKVGVLLDMEDYQKLLEELGELESIRAYDSAKASGDEAVPFEID